MKVLERIWDKYRIQILFGGMLVLIGYGIGNFIPYEKQNRVNLTVIEAQQTIGQMTVQQQQIRDKFSNLQGQLTATKDSTGRIQREQSQLQEQYILLEGQRQLLIQVILK